jgi:hypothetical protein
MARSIIGREVGMAFAVLAIWLLSLLAPMHQVSRLVTDLAEAGIVARVDWSICTQAAADDNGDSAPIKICPAHGIGKNGLAPPPSSTILAILSPVVFTVGFAPTPERFWSRIQADTGQPRAPPLPA